MPLVDLLVVLGILVVLLAAAMEELVMVLLAMLLEELEDLVVHSSELYCCTLGLLLKMLVFLPLAVGTLRRDSAVSTVEQSVVASPGKPLD